LQINGFLKPAHPYFREGGLDTVLEGMKALSRSGDSLFDLDTRSAIGRYTPDNLDRKYIAQIWCSPVMTEVHPASWGRKNQIGAQCLALYPLDEARKEYMRVGFVWIHDFEWFGDCSRSDYSIIWPAGDELACSSSSSMFWCHQNLSPLSPDERTHSFNHWTKWCECLVRHRQYIDYLTICSEKALLIQAHTTLLLAPKKLLLNCLEGKLLAAVSSLLGSNLRA